MAKDGFKKKVGLEPGSGVKPIDISALEKEYSMHEKEGFRAYKKKVGMTTSEHGWE